MSNTETFKTYLFSYEHEGASWVQEIKASDAKDAQARVRKLHAATLDGELIAKVDMPALAALPRATLWIRKMIFGR